MAWTDIRETPKGTTSTSRDDKQKLTVAVVRHFDLLTDSPTSENSLSARAALSDQGVTDTGEQIGEGSPHPGNQFYRVESISIETVSVTLYRATVNYKSPKFSGGGDNPEADPVFDPPTKQYSTVTTEEACDTDLDEKPIATATGESFEGVSRPISDLQLTITKNFATFTPSSFYEYIDTVNADTFDGFPPGVARVVSISASDVTEPDYLYWKVSVVIQFRKPYLVDPEFAWYKRIRNEGYYCYTVDKPTESTRAVDGNREPTSKPVLLDDVGFQLTTGEEPKWLRFRIFDTSTFADMNLGV